MKFLTQIIVVIIIAFAFNVNIAFAEEEPIIEEGSTISSVPFEPEEN